MSLVRTLSADPCADRCARRERVRGSGNKGGRGESVVYGACLSACLCIDLTRATRRSLGTTVQEIFFPRCLERVVRSSHLPQAAELTATVRV